jgi:hypothetical protein
MDVGSGVPGVNGLAIGMCLTKSSTSNRPVELRFDVQCWMLDVNLGLRKTPNTEHRTSNRAPIGNWSLVIAWPPALESLRLGESLEIGIYPRATFPTTKAA